MNEQNKERFVHHVFETIAEKYDKMNTLLSLGRHKRWRKFAMDKLPVQPGQSAIDVCCGTGDWTISLAQKTGSTGHVVGLDFSENMLAIAHMKKDELGLKQIELVHGNAMELPYEDNTFDYATIGFGLRNVPDIHQVLSEMCRVVKPGGLVASLELSKPVWPIFKQVYYLYLNGLLPLLGKVLANRYAQYRWLPESLRNFPDSVKLAELFRHAGLESVEVYLLTGGIAALHIGYKPGRS
jgi:demethylmenaquinone methyltransferase/2-methoxy-6-polyprenyl-1,4-benzoquinol methylase